MHAPRRLMHINGTSVHTCMHILYSEILYHDMSFSNMIWLNCILCYASSSLRIFCTFVTQYYRLEWLLIYLGHDCMFFVNLRTWINLELGSKKKKKKKWTHPESDLASLSPSPTPRIPIRSITEIVIKLTYFRSQSISAHSPVFVSNSLYFCLSFAFKLKG